MTPKRWQAGAVACVAAASLVGCSGEPPSFDDLSGLAEAVNGEGVACDGVTRKQGTDLVDEIGACRGSEVTLYVFESTAALDDWRKVAALVAPTAVGANWAVTGEPAAVERVADALGAEMAPAE